MTVTGYRDSHAMSRWSLISAVTWLVSLSFVLPPAVVLLLVPWRAITMVEEFAAASIASALMLAFSVLARRRARILDAQQRLADHFVLASPERLAAEIVIGKPMSPEQWRQLRAIVAAS